MTDPEQEDLEPQRGHMTPLWARRLWGFFGANTYTATEGKQDSPSDG